MPVNTISYDTRYDPKSKATSVGLGIYYSRQELLEKGVPLEKVEGIDEIDLTDILDGYVFALSKMQKLNRNLTKDLIDETREKLITEYEEIKQKVDDGYECHIRFSEHECLPVNLDWFEVHDYLIQKHNIPVKHSRIRTERNS